MPRRIPIRTLLTGAALAAEAAGLPDPVHQASTTRSTSFPAEIETWSEAAGKPAVQHAPGENSIDGRNQLDQGRIDCRRAGQRDASLCFVRQAWQIPHPRRLAHRRLPRQRLPGRRGAAHGRHLRCDHGQGCKRQIKRQAGRQHAKAAAGAQWFGRTSRRPTQKGQQNQAFGRSRGGFSSKVYLKTDFDGLPIGFHPTGGEVSDNTQSKMSLSMGPDITSRAAMTDKGYDAKANRAACRALGIVPVIPHRANARDRATFFPNLLYKGRARIEQALGKRKRFKPIALRCENTTGNYSSLVALACTMILIKFVHTA